MRIVFVSALEEGWEILRVILEAPEHRHDVEAVITLEDDIRAKASGSRSFDGLTSKYSKPILKVRHINHTKSIELIKALHPDLLLVIGWSQLVSKEVLEIPSKGTVGLHTSLLPEHRGRAPIPWAIIKGLKRSGNTLFYLDEGVDTGDIIGQKAFDITLEDDASTVYQKALTVGQELVLDYLTAVKAGTDVRMPQDHDKADYWAKRTPEDGLIDWSEPTMDIYNLVRGVTHPYPGAFTFLEGQKVYIWSAKFTSGDEQPKGHAEDKPGDILEVDGRLMVHTGDGYLEVHSLQLDGSKEMQASIYLSDTGGDYPRRFSDGRR